MMKAEEMIEVSDVAAALIERTGSLSTFQLMKLTYYVQAWHATIYGEPLFESRIEAWANGPVSPVLWNQYKKMDVVGKAYTGDSSKLVGEASVLIDLVISHYGHLNGDELSAISHAEKPWKDVWGNRPLSDKGNDPISIESMIAFYADKTLAGHSPIEISLVGANPQIHNEDSAEIGIAELLESFRGTKVDSTEIDTEGHERFISGFDPDIYIGVETNAPNALRN
jgi:uncharacterized phage-associated protein